MGCTCPLDAFNGTTAMVETGHPIPFWLPPQRTTPVDCWPINETVQCEWTSRPVSITKLFWLPPAASAQRPSSSLKVGGKSEGGIVVAARPLVAAMLTVILAWLVIRNLIGWHRNLPTDAGQSGAGGVVVTARGLRRPYRRRWRDDADWIDYDADDSDSFDSASTGNTLAASVENDGDRLFIGVVDASRPLGLSPPPPPPPPRCAVTYTEEEVEDDVSMLYDLTLSLSSDGWSSSGPVESLAVTGQEPPLHPTLLVCSPLAACYLGRSDESGSNITDDSEEEEEEEDVFESLSSAFSFVTPSSSMSTSFDDVLSDWEFDTASSGSRR